MEPWFADAKPINSLEPQIAFHLWDEFHPVRDRPPEPLALPEFPRAERLRVSVPEAIGHEAELAAYYGRVAALARQRGLNYADQDQGWAVEAWARNSTLYIRESDPDSDATVQAAALPRAGLQARIAPLRERTARLLARLAEELGADVWTTGEAPSFL
ncbi:MAG: hypothetical protein JF629_25545 [Variovorax paradoxus]|nr:hypothetical protein [Variovorax paradoxus]MBW8719095.1 hypothetical protein [Variovorax paradoxus]